MKTYESECEELREWFMKESERIAQIPPSGGHDGEHTEAEKAQWREFKRRLKELKEKYGKE